MKNRTKFLRLGSRKKSAPAQLTTTERLMNPNQARLQDLIQQNKAKEGK
jgi:hypothetical protein